MANIKISEASLKSALVATDMIPVAGSGDATAYHITGTKLVEFIESNIDSLPALTSAPEIAVLNSPITLGEQGEARAFTAQIASVGGAGWQLITRQAIFNEMPDEILFLGYNLSGTGLTPDATEHSWYIGLESDYYPNETDHVAEWYIQYVAAGTSDYNRRPIHCVAYIETHALEVYTRGKQYWGMSDGTSLGQLEDTVVGRLYLYNYGIRSANNNVPLLSQKNAAGTGYVDLLKLNNSNLLQIEQPATTANDFSISDNTKGFVLKDRTNGNSYRLLVNNGTLSVEQIT